ncbi:MAG: PD40 domain-containing protein [Deltaproteobacteria bacterium]|nr:PD40 domain-containing protein [Deltaproteobacteria bacterium]
MLVRRVKVTIFLLALLVTISGSANAQTDLHIAGAKVGFPIAIPQLCDTAESGAVAKEMADTMIRDLEITGIFKIINSASYLEEAGKCNMTEVNFADWSVIGTEGLVKGKLSRSDAGLQYELILYDVNRKTGVAGKRYQASADDYVQVAHRFANEILKHFTGEAGVFGTQIAFVSKVGRFKELFVMDMDGSNIRQITKDKGLALSPAWSAQGDKLLYTSYRTRKPDLYTISPNGGTPAQITNSSHMEIGAKFIRGGGSLVTSQSNGSSSNIVELDFKGKVLRKITSGGALDVSPSVSPDGSQIAFCSDRGGSPQIYVMNSDGGNIHRISFTGSSYCTSPTWSPKGDKIAFVCRDQGFHIFVSDTSGGQAVRLTYAGNNEDPSWAPDGRALAFSSNLGKGGARSIVIYSLLSGSAKQITFTKSEDAMPAWGPSL